MLKMISKYKVHMLIGAVALMPCSVAVRAVMFCVLWSIYATYFVWREHKYSREIQLAFKEAGRRKKVLEANRVITNGLGN